MEANEMFGREKLTNFEIQAKITCCMTCDYCRINKERALFCPQTSDEEEVMVHPLGICDFYEDEEE